METRISERELEQWYAQEYSAGRLTYQRLSNCVEKLIKIHRTAIGLLTTWQILPVICSSKELQGGNAVMSWRPDTWEAYLSIRDDLPTYQHLLWEVVHELFELHWSATGTLTYTLVYQVLPSLLGKQQEYIQFWMEHYRMARNQEVESAVRAYLHRDRPVSPLSLLPHAI